jgi:hypothetical protein
VASEVPRVDQETRFCTVHCPYWGGRAPRNLLRSDVRQHDDGARKSCPACSSSAA